MACIEAFEKGVAYRDLLLQVEKPSKISILESKTSNKTDSKSRNDNLDYRAVKEYIDSQRTCLYAGAIERNHCKERSLCSKYPVKIFRDLTTIMEPKQCICCKDIRALITRFKSPILATDDDNIYSRIGLLCEDTDFYEDSKAMAIVIGCIQYMRFMINPYKYAGVTVRHWDSTRMFLLKMVSWIITENIRTGDEISIRHEISTRLRTKTPFIIDTVSVTLWLLKMYDVVFGLHQETPTTHIISDWHVPESHMNDMVFAHSCHNTRFSLNIDRLLFAKYIGQSNPELARMIIAQFVEDEVHHSQRKYLPKATCV